MIDKHTKRPPCRIPLQNDHLLKLLVHTEQQMRLHIIRKHKIITKDNKKKATVTKY